MKTAAEAAVLADECVLTHRSNFRAPVYHAPGKWEEKRPPCHGKSDYTAQGHFQSDKVCNFCKERGHWKAECPKANARRGNSGVCAVSVAPVSVCPQQLKCGRGSEFSMFMPEGRVSLLGGNSVPVRILRDIAAFDSYILSSVLPFSGDSDTGDFVLMRGMGLNVEPVPLHSLCIDCGLVKGMGLPWGSAQSCRSAGWMSSSGTVLLAAGCGPTVHHPPLCHLHLW